MLKTILVAVDASPQHAAIMNQAAELAIVSGAEVHVVTVADAASKGGMALQHSCVGVFTFLGREADNVLRAACVSLSDRGVSCRTHALNGLVTEQIVALAAEIRADLIIVGHRHLSWMARFFEKSVGRDLLENAPCNVLIVKEGEDE